MGAEGTTGSHTGDVGSIESWLVAAGRDRRPGAPLNVPPWPASNFVLGGQRAYARDDGTPGWEALEELVGGLAVLTGELRAPVTLERAGGMKSKQTRRRAAAELPAGG